MAYEGWNVLFLIIGIMIGGVAGYNMGANFENEKWTEDLKRRIFGDDEEE